MTQKIKESAKDSHILKSADDVKEKMSMAPAAAIDAVAASLTEGRKSILFTLSDDSVDRDGDIVDPEGWKLDNYAANPVVLFGHDQRIPAIGTGIGVHGNGKALLGVAQFNPREIDPFGHMIGELYGIKTMRAVSVGFIAKDLRPVGDGKGYVIASQELTEFSAVNVPANPMAIAQAKAFGVDVDPLRDMAIKILDGESFVFAKSQAEKIWRELRTSASVFDFGALAKDFAAIEARAIKAERVAAKLSPVVVDWRSAAIELAKKSGASLERIKRAHTYAIEDDSDAKEFEAAQIKADEIETAAVVVEDSHLDAKETVQVDNETTTQEIEPQPQDPGVETLAVIDAVKAYFGGVKA